MKQKTHILKTHTRKSNKFNESVLSGITSIKNKLKTFTKSISGLSGKVDSLQKDFNSEHNQVVVFTAVLNNAVTDLQAVVVDLQAIIASGGTEEERQALSNKLDAVIEDIKSTIPE